MGKTYKDLKKQGKHVFDGPKVKQRKHFAPATKTEKPKKGKGSYDRGNAFDEDEERGSVNIFDYVEQKQKDGYGVALIDDNDQIITPYVDPSDYPNIELSGNGSAPRVINDPSKDGWIVMIHSGILETEPEKMGYKKYNSFDEDEEKKACWKGYEKKGTKKKGGKTVNNCVKESNTLSKFVEAIMTDNHAEAHKQLKKAVNDKIQKIISQEIDNPLF